MPCTLHPPPEHFDHLLQAQVRLQQRHYGESESLLEGVLREVPTHHEALYHLSLLYSATNRSGEALDAATVAAKTCVAPRDLCAALHAHHADLLHTLTFLDDAVTVSGVLGAGKRGGGGVWEESSVGGVQYRERGLCGMFWKGCVCVGGEGGLFGMCWVGSV